ncbi:MAG: hypothetical protein QF570_08350 [Myxococcota bacterium]|jgi:hypothetical protein|nr:hypothetical protein [Myxococcota bacterium]
MPQNRKPLVKSALVIIGLAIAIPLLAFALDHRTFLLRVAAVTLETPELGEATEEGIEAFWFDDYFLPNSSLGDYVRSTEAILARMSEDATIYGAHRLDPIGLPLLKRQDLLDLQEAFASMRAGEDDGNEEEQEFYPTRYEVNGRLSLLMDFAWGRRWD